MFRDSLVVGIRESMLSEKLQMHLDADLSLEKAKTSIRPWETVHEQQGILKHTKEDLSALNFIGKQKNQQRISDNPNRGQNRDHRSHRIRKRAACMSLLPSQGARG